MSEFVGQFKGRENRWWCVCVGEAAGGGGSHSLFVGLESWRERGRRAESLCEPPTVACLMLHGKYIGYSIAQPQYNDSPHTLSISSDP